MFYQSIAVADTLRAQQHRINLENIRMSIDRSPETLEMVKNLRDSHRYCRTNWFRRRACRN